MGSNSKSGLFFILFLITIVRVQGQNIDCNGKAFHCVNSTHFKICVDLGGGVSKTVDEFMIPCPSNTFCKETNQYECEFQISLPSTLFEPQTEVTTEATTSNVSFDDVIEIMPLSNINNNEVLEEHYNSVSTKTEYDDVAKNTVTTTSPLSKTNMSNSDAIETTTLNLSFERTTSNLTQYGTKNVNKDVHYATTTYFVFRNGTNININITENAHKNITPAVEITNYTQTLENVNKNNNRHIIENYTNKSLAVDDYNDITNLSEDINKNTSISLGNKVNVDLKEINKKKLSSLPITNDSIVTHDTNNDTVISQAIKNSEYIKTNINVSLSFPPSINAIANITKHDKKMSFSLPINVIANLAQNKNDKITPKYIDNNASFSPIVNDIKIGTIENINTPYTLTINNFSNVTGITPSNISFPVPIINETRNTNTPSFRQINNITNATKSVNSSMLFSVTNTKMSENINNNMPFLSTTNDITNATENIKSKISSSLNYINNVTENLGKSTSGLAMIPIKANTNLTKTINKKNTPENINNSSPISLLMDDVNNDTTKNINTSCTLTIDDSSNTTDNIQSNKSSSLPMNNETRNTTMQSSLISNSNNNETEYNRNLNRNISSSLPVNYIKNDTTENINTPYTFTIDDSSNVTDNINCNPSFSLPINNETKNTTMSSTLTINDNNIATEYNRNINRNISSSLPVNDIKNDTTENINMLYTLTVDDSSNVTDNINRNTSFSLPINNETRNTTMPFSLTINDDNNETEYNRNINKNILSSLPVNDIKNDTKENINTLYTLTIDDFSNVTDNINRNTSFSLPINNETRNTTMPCSLTINDNNNATEYNININRNILSSLPVNNIKNDTTENVNTRYTLTIDDSSNVTDNINRNTLFSFPIKNETRNTTMPSSLTINDDNNATEYNININRNILSSLPVNNIKNDTTENVNTPYTLTIDDSSNVIDNINRNTSFSLPINNETRNTTMPSSLTINDKNNATEYNRNINRNISFSLPVNDIKNDTTENLNTPYTFTIDDSSNVTDNIKRNTSFSLPINNETRNTTMPSSLTIKDYNNGTEYNININRKILSSLTVNDIKNDTTENINTPYTFKIDDCSNVTDDINSNTSFSLTVNNETRNDTMPSSLTINDNNNATKFNSNINRNISFSLPVNDIKNNTTENINTPYTFKIDDSSNVTDDINRNTSFSPTVNNETRNDTMPSSLTINDNNNATEYNRNINRNISFSLPVNDIKNDTTENINTPYTLRIDDFTNVTDNIQSNTSFFLPMNNEIRSTTMPSLLTINETTDATEYINNITLFSPHNTSMIENTKNNMPPSLTINNITDATKNINTSYTLTVISFTNVTDVNVHSNTSFSQPIKNETRYTNTLFPLINNDLSNMTENLNNNSWFSLSNTNKTENVNNNIYSFKINDVTNAIENINRNISSFLPTSGINNMTENLYDISSSFLMINNIDNAIKYKHKNTSFTSIKTHTNLTQGKSEKNISENIQNNSPFSLLIDDNKSINNSMLFSPSHTNTTENINNNLSSSITINDLLMQQLINATENVSRITSSSLSINNTSNVTEILDNSKLSSLIINNTDKTMANALPSQSDKYTSKETVFVNNNVLSSPITDEITNLTKNIDHKRSVFPLDSNTATTVKNSTLFLKPVNYNATADDANKNMTISFTKNAIDSNKNKDNASSFVEIDKMHLNKSNNIHLVVFDNITTLIQNKTIKLSEIVIKNKISSPEDNNYVENTTNSVTRLVLDLASSTTENINIITWSQDIATQGNNNYSTENEKRNISYLLSDKTVTTSTENVDKMLSGMESFLKITKKVKNVSNKSYFLMSDFLTNVTEKSTESAPFYPLKNKTVEFSEETEPSNVVFNKYDNTARSESLPPSLIIKDNIISSENTSKLTPIEYIKQRTSVSMVSEMFNTADIKSSHASLVASINGTDQIENQNRTSFPVDSGLLDTPITSTTSPIGISTTESILPYRDNYSENNNNITIIARINKVNNSIETSSKINSFLAISYLANSTKNINNNINSRVNNSMEITGTYSIEHTTPSAISDFFNDSIQNINNDMWSSLVSNNPIESKSNNTVRTTDVIGENPTESINKQSMVSDARIINNRNEVINNSHTDNGLSLAINDVINLPKNWTENNSFPLMKSNKIEISKLPENMSDTKKDNSVQNSATTAKIDLLIFDIEQTTIAKSQDIYTKSIIEPLQITFKPAKLKSKIEMSETQTNKPFGGNITRKDIRGFNKDFLVESTSQPWKKDNSTTGIFQKTETESLPSLQSQLMSGTEAETISPQYSEKNKNYLAQLVTATSESKPFSNSSLDIKESSIVFNFSSTELKASQEKVVTMKVRDSVYAANKSNLAEFSTKKVQQSNYVSNMGLKQVSQNKLGVTQNKTENQTYSVIVNPTNLSGNTTTSKISMQLINITGPSFLIPNMKKPNITNSTFCINRPNGRYVDEKNCSKFYICTGGLRPVIGQCPLNTVFSDIKKQCTKNLSHCIRKKQFKCLANGRYYDVFLKNIYYICVWHKNRFIKFKFQCQNGYSLNKTAIQCTSDQKSTNSSTSESESSSITDRYTLKESSTKRKIEFKCEREGKFADPNNCTRYIVCSENSKGEFRRRIKKCDFDEVWHEEKRKCVNEDSYECKSSTE